MLWLAFFSLVYWSIFSCSWYCTCWIIHKYSILRDSSLSWWLQTAICTVFSSLFLSNFAVLLCPTLTYYVAALSVHLFSGNKYVCLLSSYFPVMLTYFLHSELLYFAIWLTRMQYTATALRTYHLWNTYSLMKNCAIRSTVVDMLYIYVEF